MLSWASRFNISCFLDNHRYGLPAHSFECLLAVGARDSIQAPAGNAFAQLKDFAARHKDWLFGHLGYGLARETEPSNGHSDPIPNPAPGPTPNPAPTRNMPSQPDPIGFPDLFFFVPELLIELGPDTIRIGSFLADHSAILAAILDQGLHPHTPGPYKPRTGVSGAIPALLPRFTREEYLDTISRLQAHILRGDCYEINFCQEFFAQPATIDP